MDFDIVKHLHLLTVAGSSAYGLATDASDLDVKGVAVPPAKYYLGFDGFEQADKKEDIQALRGLVPNRLKVNMSHGFEGSVYELSKFMNMACECNPNILDVLFCRQEDVLFASGLGDALRGMAQDFLSAKAKFSFSGYAMAQLKRIKGHRAWLLNPPKGEPKRADFGLPERTLIPADQLAAVQAAISKQMDSWEIDFQSMPDSERLHVQENISRMLAQIQVGTEDAKWLAAARWVGADDNLILLMQQERAYRAAHQHWTQYRHWKVARNQARSELEAQHGYDTKHAMHLVRLMRMGQEILVTGRVHVWREDADELLAIRRGAWSYEQLVEYAEGLDGKLDEIYRTKQYVVPDKPDRNAIQAKCTQMVLERLAWHWTFDTVK